MGGRGGEAEGRDIIKRSPKPMRSRTRVRAVQKTFSVSPETSLGEFELLGEIMNGVPKPRSGK